MPLDRVTECVDPMVREGLPETVTLEPRPEWSKWMSHAYLREEGTAHTKVPRMECACSVEETGTPGWLECSEREESLNEGRRLVIRTVWFCKVRNTHFLYKTISIKELNKNNQTEPPAQCVQGSLVSWINVRQEAPWRWVPAFSHEASQHRSLFLIRKWERCLKEVQVRSSE